MLEKKKIEDENIAEKSYHSKFCSRTKNIGFARKGPERPRFLALRKKNNKNNIKRGMFLKKKNDFLSMSVQTSVVKAKSENEVCSFGSKICGETCGSFKGDC